MIIEQTHVADVTGNHCIACGDRFRTGFNASDKGKTFGHITAPASGASSWWEIKEVKTTTPEPCTFVDISLL